MSYDLKKQKEDIRLLKCPIHFTAEAISITHFFQNRRCIKFFKIFKYCTTINYNFTALLNSENTIEQKSDASLPVTFYVNSLNGLKINKKIKQKHIK